MWAARPPDLCDNSRNWASPAGPLPDRQDSAIPLVAAPSLAVARNHFVDIGTAHRDWAALAGFAVHIADFVDIGAAHMSGAADYIGYTVQVDIVMAAFVDNVAANTDQKEEAYSSSGQMWARADYRSRHRNGYPPHFAYHTYCRTP